MENYDLILVWYKSKWHIAQVCRARSRIFEDGGPQLGIMAAQFLNNKDDATIARATTIMDDFSDDMPHCLNNIEALKAALDRNILYKPTGTELDDWWADADMIRSEAGVIRRSINWHTTIDEHINFDQKHKLSQAFSDPMIFVQPSMSIECDAQILSLVAYATDRIPVHMKVENIVDWSCKWAYVIDLDRSLFEVYSGFVNFEFDAMKTEQKERFDEEEFAWKQNRRPILLMTYTFHDLEGLSDEALTKELIFARRDCRGQLQGQSSSQR